VVSSSRYRHNFDSSLRRELSRPHTQTVHLVHHAQVTIQIVAASISRTAASFPFGSNSLDVSGIEGELYLITILLQLLKCIVKPPQRLLRLQNDRDSTPQEYRTDRKKAPTPPSLARGRSQYPSSLRVPILPLL